MEKKKDVTPQFYKIAYGLFVLLALYQILVRRDFIDGASSMGIALVFDPFDQTVGWNERPFYQKAWLIVHLGVAAALLGYGISIG